MKGRKGFQRLLGAGWKLWEVTAVGLGGCGDGVVEPSLHEAANITEG